jgi:flagellar basal-body rod modification protein FlgD
VSNIIQSISNSVYAATSTDTSTTPTATAQPGGKMDKDAFLKLLTTQMRYQDPMDPMDGKQMAADLAQFSGLEQLLNINTTLTAQQGQYAQLAQAMSNTSAMSAIGHNAMVNTDKVILTKAADGTLGGSVVADIKTSGVAKLTLLDKSGKEVGSRSLGYIGTGAQQTFDIGSAAKGLSVEGAYQVRLDVTGTDGKDVAQQTYTVGKIDGMTFAQDGSAMLTMGPLSIALNAIVKLLA